MSNINVRVVGTANVTQMSGAFGKLEAQVTQLNAQLKEMVVLQNSVDASGYERMARAAAQNSKVFRNAAASTGMFEVQQLKVNKATDDYIRRLQKQNMGFRELIKNRKIASAALKEQLAMEQMVVRQSRTGTAHGRSVLDVAYPREITQDMYTASKRLSFFNEQLKSGANQMLNWGKNTQWAGRQLMVGFTMPVAAFGAAAGVMAYQVDKQLTRIAKVYDTTADANNTTLEGQMALEKELAQVREAGIQTAIKAAREYGAAGQDTLEVQAELAATGQQGAELQKNTAEVMRIARLGELDHQDAIQATIALQSVFRMSNKELTESFNYMNAVENATSLQTEDFAQAIPIASGVVKEFGGDVQELGILLTAMKERGIEATQGANAIKAAMQRLGRPSAQVQEEWEALTGTDITKLFNESTSLIDLFKRIADAVDGLTNKERIKAFAGLFGTYQVTRMSALVKGMQDLEAGTGQVSTAFELASGSATQWADTAEREMQRYRESISGQFETSLEEVKMQLSTLGEPFVEVATMALRAISDLISYFNDLPKPVKIGIAALLGIAAVAGPIIMLTGLLANLLAQGIKTFTTISGWILKLNGGLNIMTTDQKAAAMAAQLHSAELTKEAKAAELLAMQLQRLAASQRAANAATTQAAITSLTAQGMSQPVATATVLGQQMRSLSAEDDILASTRIADNAEKTNRNWKGIATHAGVAATAGATMLMTSDGILGNLAEIVFYASLLGPMLGLSGGVFRRSWKTVAPIITSSFNKIKGIPAAIAAAGGPMKALGKGAAGLGGLMKRAGAAAIGMTGPIGLVVAGIAAASYGLYKWHQWNEKIKEQERAQERAIVSRSNLLSNSLDIQIRKQKQLNLLSGSNVPGSGELTSTELSKELTQSQSGKDLVAGYKDASEAEQATIATQKYIEVLNAVGGNSLKARKYVEALFLAAGDGALEAQSKAMRLFTTLGGEIDEIERQAQIGSLFELNIDSSDEEQARIQGENLGKQLADGMARAGDNAGRMKVFERFAMTIDDSFNDLFNTLGTHTTDIFKQWGVDSGAELRNIIADHKKVIEGDLSLASFSEMYGLDMNSKQFTQDYNDLSKAIDVSTSLIGQQMTNLGTAEEAVVTELAKQLGIKENITTLSQLQATQEFQIMTANKQQTEAQWQVYLATVRAADAAAGMLGNSQKTTYEQKLQALNARRLALGMKETGLLSDEFNRRTVDVNGNLIRQRTITIEIGGKMVTLNGQMDEEGDKIDENNSKLRAQVGIANQVASAFRSLSGTDFLSAYQSGMQGVQEDIADAYRDDFDNRMNDALEARQDMWDRRTESLQSDMQREQDALERSQDRQSSALEARHERQQNALDAHWEKRMDAAERYWDRRVELVDKAIEAEEKAEEKRQKMFDAEIARINKLNEMANQNIDFNVALSQGQFDEAAKIRNDATADAAATALERAAGAGAGRSARRIEQLEGRRDSIDKARERAMQQLQAQEEAQKASLERRQAAEQAHLQKMQEAQRRHLEKVQKMREEALQDAAEADMETQRDIWENEKESLEERLALFLQYIAANEKDLKRHMRDVGLSYHKFGKEVLKPEGEDWSSFFGERLKYHVRKAGLQLASDKVWEKLGKGSVRGLLEGMGFHGMNEFRNFIQTGKFGTGRGGLGNRGGGRGSAKLKNTPEDNMGGITKYTQSTRHEGGFVDESPGSRKGVARTLRGLHPNEQMVRAQKGEFVVNKDDAQNNKELLERINRGENAGFDKPHGGAGSPLMAGYMAAALNTAMARGVGMAMQNAYVKKLAKIRRRQQVRGFAGADAGMYGDRYFNASQLRNARIIASVGKHMGMSERDIMIGIMTAITESGLVNVDYGDRDSLGLFQQRPSMGWGTPAQVTNPKYASAKFFSTLKGVTNRGALSPWLAAQAVQRSAFESGSNYRQYWDEAQAIWKAMETSGGRGGGRMYAAGPGGWSKPAPSGYGWSNSHDYGVPRHTPLYAVSDGAIVESRAITSGGSPGNGLYTTPYRSYGETVVMRTQSGDLFRYAHLSPGTRIGAGRRVKGGTKIGESGETGNAWGAHVHFDVNGNYDARGWLARHGIHLKDGAREIRWDNTIANLHHGEGVLTKPLNEKLHQGIDNFASGGNNEYHFHINGEGLNAEEIANKVMTKIKREESRKPRGRGRG